MVTYKYIIMHSVLFYVYKLNFNRYLCRSETWLSFDKSCSSIDIIWAIYGDMREDVWNKTLCVTQQGSISSTLIYYTTPCDS